MREKAKKSNDSLVAGFSGLRQKIKEKRQEKRSKNEERQKKVLFYLFRGSVTCAHTKLADATRYTPTRFERSESVGMRSVHLYTIHKVHWNVLHPTYTSPSSSASKLVRSFFEAFTIR